MKIAIVFPSGHFFDTPCVPNLAEALAKNGCEVDIYTVQNLATPSGTLKCDRLSLIWFPIIQTKSRENIVALMTGFFFWIGKSFIRNKYDYVIAAGIRSLFLIGTLSLLFRFKYVYNSLEIYSGKRFNNLKGKIFKKIESYFNRRSFISIIQDESRARILKNTNKLADHHQILTFPNTPIIDAHCQSHQSPNTKSFVKDNLNTKFGIPKGKNILLYSGTLSEPWASCEKIVASAQNFTEDWCLFLQSRMKEDETLLASKLGPSIIKDTRVVYSHKPLSTEEYTELLKGITIGLAWYESDDENIIYTGLSSGKIAAYLFHGKPIIVNRIPMYDEICTEYNCGIVVDNVKEIPAAIVTIMRDYSAFSAGALNAYTNLFNLSKHIGEIASVLSRAIGKD